MPIGCFCKSGIPGIFPLRGSRSIAEAPETQKKQSPHKGSVLRVYPIELLLDPLGSASAAFAFGILLERRDPFFAVF